MDNLTPITREEMLMNDEPLTPITREEEILAGEDLNPVTRREYFLKKYRHAGGDVMVEGLSVTENGTYTAPEGKAYSPVEVAVPLPDNAYLLKEASGSLVSFSNGADLPMPSFICNIDAVQDLHGYDSPWVGGAGKNKLPNEITNATEGGITFSTQPNGKIKISGTSTKNLYETDICENFSLPLGQYILSYDAVDGVTVQICNRAENREYCAVRASAPSVTFTVDETKQNDMKVRFTMGNGVTVNGETGVMIRLSTEQDATFAPYSNICPISGHTGVDAWVRGKNQWDEEWELGSINTTTGEKITSSASIITKNYIPVKASTTYFLKSPNSRVFFYDKNKNFISYIGWIGNTTFTTPSNAVYLLCRFADQYGTTYNNDISINYPSTDTDYHAYNSNSQTIQVSWQTEAGEVFGGYIDLVSGVLTVTHKSKTGFTIEGQDSSNKLYNIGAIWDMKSSSNVNVTDNYFEPLNLDDARASETPSITQHLRILYVGGYIGKEAELDTLLETLQVKYELETPITYQLTPQQIKSLLGNNNAWCSTGDVAIDYFAKEV